MNNNIKAIETQYKGYMFRSRLEARWAVFFDALGVEWQYEAEGLAMRSGYYLPDFYLPRSRVYVEVKGVRPSREEMDVHCSRGCEFVDSGSHYLMVVGLPGEYGAMLSADRGLPGLAGVARHHGGVRFMYGGSALAFLCIEDVMCSVGTELVPVLQVPEDNAALLTAHPKVVSAFHAAKQARFEHGRQG